MACAPAVPLVPVPDKIFASLDKFQKSNWKNVRRLELTHCRPGDEQAQTALRLGATIAEGFVAVEAEDVSEVKDIGKTVLTLARDGYRSRVSDVLNAVERDFITLTEVSVAPIGGGPIELHPYLTLARRHIVFAVAASDPA